MKYDDASWHSEGDFPDDLPESAAATHIGLYFAWAVLAGLGSEELLDDFDDEIEQLKSRAATPASLIKCMDGKMIDEDLSEEGNSFTQSYYVEASGSGLGKAFLDDYDILSSKNQASYYHIADSWENYDLLKPVFDKRLAWWRSSK